MPAQRVLGRTQPQVPVVPENSTKFGEANNFAKKKPALTQNSLRNAHKIDMQDANVAVTQKKKVFQDPGRVGNKKCLGRGGRDT